LDIMPTYEELIRIRKYTLLNSQLNEK